MMSTQGSGKLYLMVGPDRAGKFQRVQELERALKIQPLDRHHVDATRMTAAQLLALCRQQPAISPVRLIVVDQAHCMDLTGAQALLDHATLIVRTACLILFVEHALSVRHPLLAAEGVMVVERFPGRDAPAAKPFVLTDALGTRNVADALNAMQDQLLAGKDPLELLGLIAWQLNRWVTVKRLQQAGYSLEGIASASGLRLWQAQRAQSEVMRRPLASLQQLLVRCWQLHADAKRGRVVPTLAIEQLVIELCLGAENAGVERTFAQPRPAPR